MNICVTIHVLHILLGFGLICFSLVSGSLALKWLNELKGVGMYMVFVLGSLSLFVAGLIMILT